jgi:hypothetical protein
MIMIHHVQDLYTNITGTTPTADLTGKRDAYMHACYMQDANSTLCHMFEGLANAFCAIAMADSVCWI